MPKVREKTIKESTKTHFTRLSSKGQIVLPKALRQRFGFDKGDFIELSVVEEPTINEKVIYIKKSPSIFELAGTFKPKNKKILKPENVRKYMEKNYERA